MLKIFSKLKLLLLNRYYHFTFNVHPTTVFLGKVNYYNPKKIYIGGHCSINIGVFFNVSSKLLIGNNVTISANVFITTTGLDLTHFPNKVHFSQDTFIEDDVWIGAGSIILPGVTLKKGSVIGAGSIVTKDTEEFSVYAGNPAKKIRHLND
jgi:acetyltransferase-like isoleucine patch superfamily enzyme